MLDSAGNSSAGLGVGATPVTQARSLKASDASSFSFLFMNVSKDHRHLRKASNRKMVDACEFF